MSSRRLSAWTAGGLLVLLVGSCSDRPPPSLETVLHPGLEGVAEGVSEVLTEGRRTHEVALGAAQNAVDKAEAYGELGKLYQAHTYWEAAAGCYRNAELLDPSDGAWPHLLGLVYREQGRHSEALASFELAIERDSARVASHWYLAETALELGDLETAAEHFRAANRLDPDSAATLSGIGRVALAQGRHEAAIEALERSLRLAPEALGLRTPLGMAYRRLGDIERAQSYLQSASGSLPEPHDALLQEVREKGWALQRHKLRATRAARAGDLEEAIAAYRDAIEEAPQSSQLHLNLGIALGRSGAVDEASRHLELAVRLATAPGELRVAHLNLAVVARQRGDLSSAVVHLNKALEIDPDFFRGRLFLADALLTQGDFEAAAEEFKVAVASKPGLADGYLGLSLTHEKRAQWAKARGVLEQGLRSVPGDPRMTRELCRILAAAPVEAVRDGERSHELATDLYRRFPSVEAAEVLAMAAAELGNFDEAVEWQRAALKGARSKRDQKSLAQLEKHLKAYLEKRPPRLPG